MFLIAFSKLRYCADVPTANAPALVRWFLVLVLADVGAILGPIGLLILIAKFGERFGKRARAERSEPRRLSDEARHLARRIKLRRRPTLILRAAATPRFSKLGGLPTLPVDVEWPQGRDGALRFLCQLDLTHVRSKGGPEWLPDEGRLYAFHDDWWGDAAQVRLIYASATSILNEAEAPQITAWPYDERYVDFDASSSLPSLEWLGEDFSSLGLTSEELDFLSDLQRSPEAGPRHLIGGYPEEIQGERMPISCELLSRGYNPYDGAEITPDVERAARAWRLILQVDSDSDLGMTWGDSGRLYVFGRERDLAKGGFERTVTIYQTY